MPPTSFTNINLRLRLSPIHIPRDSTVRRVFRGINIYGLWAFGHGKPATCVGEWETLNLAADPHGTESRRHGQSVRSHLYP